MKQGRRFNSRTAEKPLRQMQRPMVSAPQVLIPFYAENVPAGGVVAHCMPGVEGVFRRCCIHAEGLPKGKGIVLFELERQGIGESARVQFSVKQGQSQVLEQPLPVSPADRFTLYSLDEVKTVWMSIVFIPQRAELIPLLLEEQS